MKVLKSISKKWFFGFGLPKFQEREFVAGNLFCTRVDSRKFSWKFDAEMLMAESSAWLGCMYVSNWIFKKRRNDSIILLTAFALIINALWEFPTPWLPSSTFAPKTRIIGSLRSRDSEHCVYSILMRSPFHWIFKSCLQKSNNGIDVLVALRSATNFC